MEKAIAGYDPMEEIEANHAALEEAGHWGVPTMVFEGEPFFGQDRIDTLRWRLDKPVEEADTLETLKELLG